MCHDVTPMVTSIYIHGVIFDGGTVNSYGAIKYRLLTLLVSGLYFTSKFLLS